VLSWVVPIGKEHDFKGVVDLLTRKVLIWGGDELGAKFEVSDNIPETLKEEVETSRKH